MVPLGWSLVPHVTSESTLALALPEFSLVDQEARPFTLSTLAGKVWIADFIYTACPSVCPRLTRRMHEIQERTADFGHELQLVSISVDPENDTPERLRRFAAEYHADFGRWTFVTGPFDSIERTVVQGFKVAMGKTPSPEGVPSGERGHDASQGGGSLLSLFHGERLVLVDQRGRIRGYYDADDDGVERLLRAANRLVVAG
jgi:protein SCO1/2